MIINSPMLDYVTLTTFSESPIDLWKEFPLEGFDIERHDARFNGYKGEILAGSTGSIVIAEGQQIHPQDKVVRPHYVCKVSGEMANTFFAYHRSLDYGKCTVEQKRIDCQITIPLPPGYSAMRFYLALKEAVKDDSRPLVMRIIESGTGKQKGLDTVYLFSRTSPRYVRLYVKEDANENRYLRWEVEQKKDWAKLYHPGLLHSDLLSSLRKIPMEIRSSIVGGFINDFVFCLSDLSKRRVVPGKTRDTVKWLYDQITPAILNAYNDHTIGGHVRIWLDELIASLPDDPIED